MIKKLKKGLTNCFAYLLFWSIQLRYRVKVIGLKEIPFDKGVVFLPNHPAEIDPVILSVLLWKRYQPRPLILESFYFLRGAQWIQRWAWPVLIPDMSGVITPWKEMKVKKSFCQVVEGLKQGDNFLIYPSGRLKETGKELLGGASFVHDLMQVYPELSIVLVRTTGLWGSRFSRALTGHTPDVKKIFWKGVRIILKNFIFFTPRREVLVELEVAPPDLPRHASSHELNRYLEKWYNLRGIEPLTRIRDFFWSTPLSTEISQEESQPAIPRFSNLSSEIREEIFNEVRRLSGHPDVDSSQHLAYDLGLDSLDISELYLYLKDRYEIEGIESLSLERVEDLLTAVSSKTSQTKRSSPPLSKITTQWFAEGVRPPVRVPLGRTLQEAFLRSCDRMGGYIACGDDSLGVFTYRRLKVAALTLSHALRSLEGEHVGVLLPSSTGAYLLVFALLLANKVPVMLNWTLGMRNLTYAMQAAGIKRVLTSEKFLDRWQNGDFTAFEEEQLLLIEDISRKLSLGQKILGALKAYLPYHCLRFFSLYPFLEERTAVILFTSGTESLPKGVPLSHRNILSNQKAGLSRMSFSSKDSMYGVLPPFHSFGFSVTGILPLLAGLKVYYAPDPTDSFKIACDIARWKLTIFCAAPTFIMGLIRTISSIELPTLRYLVSGAEKAQKEILDWAKQKGLILIEGYGITECSPVVTMKLPEDQGVGKPLPGVDLAIVDEERKKILPLGETGEICIKGPNLFKGYLKPVTPSPFVQLEGCLWYCSGDLGHLEADGSLVLSGRLKRFVKIGGEMISLGNIEEEILTLVPIPPDVPSPSLALAVKEGHKPLLILFATFNLDREKLNKGLREKGYGNLIKIAETRRVERIPVTGAGKVQYGALDEII